MAEPTPEPTNDETIKDLNVVVEYLTRTVRVLIRANESGDAAEIKRATGLAKKIAALMDEAVET